MPVLEAMAHGVPVLTANRPALAEVAADAAMLIDPADSDAMADGLRQMMQDSQLREQLQRKGTERASQFSWARTVRETYAIYEELAA